MSWHSVSETKNSNKPLRLIKAVLIGLIILTIVLLVSSCVNNVSLAPLPPINCINESKTPLDDKKCLAEYDQAYGSLMKMINEANQ